MKKTTFTGGFIWVGGGDTGQWQSCPLSEVSPSPPTFPPFHGLGNPPFNIFCIKSALIGPKLLAGYE